jgi:hypothetical protein
MSAGTVSAGPGSGPAPTGRRRRVDALGGLVELLRVAEQHDVARRAAHRPPRWPAPPGRPRRRTACRPCRHLVARPQPGRAGDDVHPAVGQCLVDLAVVLDAVSPTDRRPRRPPCPSACTQRTRLASRRPPRGTAMSRLPITLWLFERDAHHAPRPAAAHEVEDHPRAGVRLARAGRALDGEGRAVELGRQAARRLRARLALAPDELQSAEGLPRSRGPRSSRSRAARHSARPSRCRCRRPTRRGASAPPAAAGAE